MVQMKFNTRIKYRGQIYKGLEPFDVRADDVAEMQSRGGVVIIDKDAKSAEEKTKDEPEKGAEAPKRGKRKAAGDE